ncbi:unnamed protein product [Lota lota]
MGVFRIHHRLAAELAWRSCISCQSWSGLALSSHFMYERASEQKRSERKTRNESSQSPARQHSEAEGRRGVLRVWAAHPPGCVRRHAGRDSQ